jgi:hypothetical protein
MPQGMPAGAEGVLPPAALARGPDQPRTVIRGLMPEQPGEAPAPRPAPPTMPSPAELGVGTVRASGRDETVDWNAALARAHRLGATSFNVSQPPQGGCQVTLLLPTGVAGRIEHVEATAGSEAVAVRLALERAEQWAAQRCP